MNINSTAATFPTRILAESLTAWKLAFDHHTPAAMVDLFSPDAIFQGLSPNLLSGRDEVFKYYDVLPPGITANFKVIQGRQITPHLVCGFAAVHFTYPTGRMVPVQLSLVLRRDGQTWFIVQYHASTLSSANQSGTNHASET